jgi:hypothetical protein
MESASLRIVLVALVSFAATVPVVAQTDSGATEKAAADMVATQIRTQGYACDDPATAKPDQEASEPDENAWILTCKNATYRVRLVPDMAAQVEQIN